MTREDATAILRKYPSPDRATWDPADRAAFEGWEAAELARKASARTASGIRVQIHGGTDEEVRALTEVLRAQGLEPMPGKES
jgi:hypothetical protein